MEINLSPKVRAALYILTGVGSPVVAYLQAVQIIDAKLVALWLAEVTFISLLAKFNTPKYEV